MYMYIPDIQPPLSQTPQEEDNVHYICMHVKGYFLAFPNTTYSVLFCSIFLRLFSGHFAISLVYIPIYLYYSGLGTSSQNQTKTFFAPVTNLRSSTNFITNFIFISCCLTTQATSEIFVAFRLVMWYSKQCFLEMFMAFYDLYRGPQASYREFLLGVLKHYEDNVL